MTKKLHHRVYVGELDRAVLGERKFAAANPDHDPRLPCLYVGQTGIPIKKRWEQHLSGVKSNRYVRKYGVRLRPDLYEHIPPMTWQDSVAMENQHGEDLRGAGFAVWWG